MTTRLSYNSLIEAGQEWAERNDEKYAHESGCVEVKTTDARCAPYSYRFVKYFPNGSMAFSTIMGASTCRQLYDFLSR